MWAPAVPVPAPCLPSRVCANNACSVCCGAWLLVRRRRCWRVKYNVSLAAPLAAAAWRWARGWEPPWQIDRSRAPAASAPATGENGESCGAPSPGVASAGLAARCGPRESVEVPHKRNPPKGSGSPRAGVRPPPPPPPPAARAYQPPVPPPEHAPPLRPSFTVALRTLPKLSQQQGKARIFSSEMHVQRQRRSALTQCPDGQRRQRRAAAAVERSTAQKCRTGRSARISLAQCKAWRAS